MWGWIILISGLGLEWRGHVVVTDITKRENQRLTDQLNSAEALAGEAIKRASELDLAKVELESRLEQLRHENLAKAREIEGLKLERLDIEKELAPRRLSLREKVQISITLSNAPDSVVIIAPPFDEEASDFADDIEFALKEARWQTSRVDGQ